MHAAPPRPKLIPPKNLHLIGLTERLVKIYTLRCTLFPRGGGVYP